MGAKQTVSATVLEVETPSGPGRARITVGGPIGLLCLGHGAGGGIEAPDLVAVTGAAAAAGWTVAAIEQPYRVAGRRAPERAPKLDAAWVEIVAELRRRFAAGPLVTGGRSSGARVACRTAGLCDAAAVVCLAFPLRPPRRPAQQSRLHELLAVDVPVLVVQGERDAFGTPVDFPAEVDLVAVPGDHSLRRSAGDVGAVVAAWLGQRVA
jgi:predicted alpha/beta-hydrolase family hydrolase